ncbi:Uncharacterized protein TCM_007912 [Theobroma cacao]|uniref:Integrase zinc-binding domain-containing protein n=1 Tax=Theobroma cacao TaxID=3641 RepID=A0A061E4L5_THECC|nr:Uncharacterized protein TCM_007912 [Theobroma cacao]
MVTYATKPKSNSMPINRLSPKKLKDNRNKGLCFNCNKNFSPRYRYKKLFLIKGCWSDDDDDADVELEDMDEVPKVSIHAISGTRVPQAMNVHEHKKGKENLVVDVLSQRHEQGELATISSPIQLCFIFFVCLFLLVKDHEHVFFNFKAKLKIDFNFSIFKTHQGKTSEDTQVIKMARVSWIIEKQFYTYLSSWLSGLYLLGPYTSHGSGLSCDIVEEMHYRTHEGYHKTFEKVSLVFYKPGMRRTVHDYIRTYDTCQRQKTKSLKLVRLIHSLSISIEVWIDISMDFVKGLPKLNGKFVLFVVIDRYEISIDNRTFDPTHHDYLTIIHFIYMLVQHNKIKLESMQITMSTIKKMKMKNGHASVHEGNVIKKMHRFHSKKQEMKGLYNNDK